MAKRKGDLLSEDTFISTPNEELIISKSATIYCGRQPRLEAHGKSKVLSRKSIGIGRDKSNAVIIADAKVSKFHALITFKKDSAYVRDSRSTNGTTVNGTALAPGTEHEIKSGDLLIVGSTELRLRY